MDLELQFQTEGEGILHYGEHGPVPTFFRPVAVVTVKISIICFFKRYIFSL